MTTIPPPAGDEQQSAIDWVAQSIAAVGTNSTIKAIVAVDDPWWRDALLDAYEAHPQVRQQWEVWNTRYRRKQPSPVISDAYTTNAVDAECEKVRTAYEGSRNSTLNDAAFALGQLVAADWNDLTRETAERFLTEAAHECGLSGYEVAATVKSGLDAGMKEPRRAPEPEAASSNGQVPKPTPPTPCSLADCEQVFVKWFGNEYDLDILRGTLAAAAGNQFDGDPCWLLLLGGPGALKTETAQALTGSGATVVSTISSDAALLSGSSKKDIAKNATGGLLKEVGDTGVLAIKDVTSILSENRDTRQKILAALREVYDGHWVRRLGTDGGRVIPWQGRLIVIGAVTSAWDNAHAVISTMGDRFVILRLDTKDSVTRKQAGRLSARNTGSEVEMRAELAAAVGGVLADLTKPPDQLDDADVNKLLVVADVVTLARTAVQRDYRGDVIGADEPEMPTRFMKQLVQLVRGGMAIGMAHDEAMRLALRCARDSLPPRRLRIMLDVLANPYSTTTDVRRRLEEPHNTIDRELQALHLLGVLTQVDDGPDTKWRYVVTEGIDVIALQ